MGGPQCLKGDGWGEEETAGLVEWFSRERSCFMISDSYICTYSYTYYAINIRSFANLLVSLMT